MDPMIPLPTSVGAAPHLEQDGASPQLLALERELSGPGAREALARHDAVLLGLEKRIADTLRASVSPDDFPKLEQLRDANVVARKILRLALRDGETNNP